MKRLLNILVFLFIFVACGKDTTDGGVHQHVDTTPVTVDTVPEIPGDTTDHINARIDTVYIDGVNLLQNGDLESWTISTYDFIDGWSCHNNDNVRRGTDKVYSGMYSARMSSTKSGSTATIDQRIKVTPGQKLRLRFRYYIDGWKDNTNIYNFDGARLYCYFRTGLSASTNIKADDIRAFYGDDGYYMFRGGGYGKKYLLFVPVLWWTFDETFTVMPGANYFVFGINSYNGTTIYIDDCVVCEQNEDYWYVYEY